MGVSGFITLASCCWSLSKKQIKRLCSKNENNSPNEEMALASTSDSAIIQIPHSSIENNTEDNKHTASSSSSNQEEHNDNNIINKQLLAFMENVTEQMAELRENNAKMMETLVGLEKKEQ